MLHRCETMLCILHKVAPPPYLRGRGGGKGGGGGLGGKVGRGVGGKVGGGLGEGVYPCIPPRRLVVFERRFASSRRGLLIVDTVSMSWTQSDNTSAPFPKTSC